MWKGRLALVAALLLETANCSCFSDDSAAGVCLLQLGSSSSRLFSAARLSKLHEEARKTIAKEAEQVAGRIRSGNQELSQDEREHLARMFQQTYQFSAAKAWSIFEKDNTTLVSTGDIRQMWLRDSSVQNEVYLPLAARSDGVYAVLASIMKRQVRFMSEDMYASAFDPLGPNKEECPRTQSCPNCRCDTCQPACGPFTYQHDFELDAPLFVMKFHYDAWKATGKTAHLDQDFAVVAREVLELLRTEQHHNAKSQYFYKAEKSQVADGTGLVWSFARPSDDQTELGYNIPQNMMVVVVTSMISEMASEVLKDKGLSKEAADISNEVEAAIEKYAVGQQGNNSKMYAFEVDGKGRQLFLDDANMPNLLWLPFLGYKDRLVLYQDTRRYDLSARNPNFFQDQQQQQEQAFPVADSGRSPVEGLGSTHESHGLRPGGSRECRGHCIWHLGLIAEGTTSQNKSEKVRILREILKTDASTNLLHEGFSPENPSQYNRDQFGWADSFFARWMLKDFAS
ncbi:unnamed protein product [Polarella glacialis]|uniref:Alpha,alpha-trehalase n=1 Tax=Polarella glacialis TaxID=89957 RepID=A0A813I3E6_POLGL|nr:unnamed protein product [Polarella glacialis]